MGDRNQGEVRNAGRFVTGVRGLPRAATERPSRKDQAIYRGANIADYEAVRREVITAAQARKVAVDVQRDGQILYYQLVKP